MNKPYTVLFMDWLHVNKGKMKTTLDPNRLSEYGKKTVEEDEREFGPIYELSGHGTKPTQLPHGIRITIEKARKSKPWLLPDQTWEKFLNWITVFQDEGRYRCWYVSYAAGVGISVTQRVRMVFTGPNLLWICTPLTAQKKTT